MDQYLDPQFYSQPVVLLDSDGDPMSLEQQMQYMRDRSGKCDRRIIVIGHINETDLYPSFQTNTTTSSCWSIQL